jgi:hypothetical protein
LHFAAGRRSSAFPGYGRSPHPNRCGPHRLPPTLLLSHLYKAGGPSSRPVLCAPPRLWPRERATSPPPSGPAPPRRDPAGGDLLPPRQARICDFELASVVSSFRRPDRGGCRLRLGGDGGRRRSRSSPPAAPPWPPGRRRLQPGSSRLPCLQVAVGLPIFPGL